MYILGSILAGGLVGYLVGTISYCPTGACPLTRNPLHAAIAGAVFGLLFALGR